PTPFMLRSVMTTWKLPVSIWRSASSPLVVVSTWYPSLPRRPFKARHIARSSSTMSTRPCMASAAPEEAGEIARQRDGRPREPAERNLQLPPGVRRREERGPIPLEDAVARPVDGPRAEDERGAPGRGA